MPRRARKKSTTDVYHVMMRGNNKQEIFHDTEDCRKYLYKLRDFKTICGYEMFAYCLMPNHVHLLMRTGDEPLGQTIQRISSSYVYWYNLKYKRVGHLFQGRFRSEAVEDDSYFLTALRYIIQNPAKAGLERAPGTYLWNSYLSYAGRNDHLTDTEFAVDLYGSREELLKYLCKENSDTGLDITENRVGLTDEDALRIIDEVTGCKTPSEFKGIGKDRQSECLKILRERNLSGSQISRLTGIPRTSVRRALI